MKGIVWIILAGLVITSNFTVAAVDPAVVQGQNDWTVDVKFTNLQQIEVKLPGSRTPQRFWYTIITLTNKTKRDVDFFPKCELMTDTFQIVSAGKRTPAAVFDKIKTRYQTKFSFVEPLEKVENRILQGTDNAKDIAVIWPDFDPKAKAATLFITGLSNETAVVKHPVLKDSDGMPKLIFLRKTLELNYNLAGDPAFRSDTRLTFKSKRWIMR